VALFGAAAFGVACVTLLSLHDNWPHPAPDSFRHRAGHVSAFGILSLLLLPLGRGQTQKWVIAAAILSFALILELVQYQVFHFHRVHQPFEWWDIRDDSVGLLLALLALRFARVHP
jgi:hypothetical protein